MINFAKGKQIYLFLRKDAVYLLPVNTDWLFIGIYFMIIESQNLRKWFIDFFNAGRTLEIT